MIDKISGIDTELFLHDDAQTLQYCERPKSDLWYSHLDEPVNLCQALNMLFTSLCNDRAVQIMKMRYGLNSGVQQTLESIGQHIGMTKQRVKAIEKSSLQKLRHPNGGFLGDEISKPFYLLLRESGGLMREDDICKKLPKVALLNNYHPLGVASFILQLTQDFIRMPDKVWVLKCMPVDAIDDIRSQAIDVLAKNLTRMRCEYLVSKIADNLGTKLISKSFIEACLRTCRKLRVADDGWCLLTKWQNSYIADVVELLRNAGRPLHYEEIATEMSILSSAIIRISKRSVYNMLLRFKYIFVWVAPGTFGLAEWAGERKLVKQRG